MSTHALTHSGAEGLEAGKQPDKHSHVYNVLYKEVFFFVFLSLQARQINSAVSLFVFMCRLLCQRMF